MAARSEADNDPERNGERGVEQVLTASVPAAEQLTVIDVGANVGVWSTAMARFRGQAPLRIFAFEPAPPVAAILKRNVAHLGDRVTVVEAAAAEADGTTQFFFRPDNTLISSVLDFGDASAQPMTIRTVRLDTFVQAQGIAHIHLLKVDAEGYDMEVLRGAVPLLSEKKVDVIQFEYNFLWVYSRHFLRDAFELLLPLGYRIGKVTPGGVEFYQRWQPLMERFHDANYVACLPEWCARFARLTPPWPE